MVNQESNQVCRSSKEVGDRTLNILMMTHSAWGPMVTETWRGESPETHGEYYAVTMPKLAEMLTGTLSSGNPVGSMAGPGILVQVVDRTGIEGAWHVVLDYSFDRDLALSSVSASLEKQGLRLERTTTPVEKLFVDKAEKTPTENYVLHRSIDRVSSTYLN